MRKVVPAVLQAISQMAEAVRHAMQAPSAIAKAAPLMEHAQPPVPIVFKITPQVKTAPPVNGLVIQPALPAMELRIQAAFPVTQVALSKSPITPALISAIRVAKLAMASRRQTVSLVSQTKSFLSIGTVMRILSTAIVIPATSLQGTF
jgi:hypothetical protein